MKKFLVTTAATGALVALSTPASADAYLSIFGGANMMDDQGGNLFSNNGSVSTSGILVNYFGSNSIWSGTYSGITYIYDSASHVWRGFSGTRDYHSELNADVEVDSGFVIGAALGCEVSKGLNVELEMALRKNDAKAQAEFYSTYSISGSSGVYFDYHYTIFATSTFPSGSGIFVAFTPTSGTFSGPNSFLTTGGTTTTDSATGELRGFSIMANVWYDIDLGDNQSFTPYIGGGIGWADVELDLGAYTASDSGLALQVGGGVRFDLAEGVEMDLGYRYFTAPDLDFVTRLGYDMGVDYEAHEVTVGFRFAL